MPLLKDRNMVGRTLLATATLIVLITIGYFILSNPAPLPLPPRDSDAFRMAVANIHFENSHGNEISESLLNTGSDLLILFEWTGKNLNLKPLKARGYTIVLNEPRRGVHGVIVIAKHPEIRDAVLLPAPVRGPCPIPLAAIRVHWKGKFVTILGVHAPPPVPACKETTEPTLQAIASWVQGGRLVRPVGSGDAGEPVIIAGDLNVSPFNSVLQELSEAGLQDAYSTTSWRPGPTWAPRPWLPACVRIDYIWIPKGFRTLNAHVAPLPGSDHRGVVIDMQ